MKKRLILFLVICILLSPASAAAEVIGHIYKTDIKAYENYMQIPSYNCGGTTAIFARDLENYGYDILWDEESMTVEIAKNTSKEFTPMLPQLQGEEPDGTILFDIYRTDIKTFFEGEEIPAYNIGGKIAIEFRSLDSGDNMNYDDKSRRALLLTKEVKLTDEEKEHIDYMYEILDILSVLDRDLAAAKEMAESEKFSKTTMENLGTSSQALSEAMEAFSEYSEPYIFSESTLEMWWAMVNLDLAATLMKSSWNVFSDEDMEKYERYTADSLSQRESALALLAAEF